MEAVKPIAEAMFRRLVARLSAEQLHQFPTAYLPVAVPLDAVDPDAEPDKWAALEALAWRATERDMAQRCGDAAQLGEAFGDALGVAESASPRGADELSRLCDEHATRCSRADPARHGPPDTGPTLERARARAAEIGERVGALSRALGVIDRDCLGSDAFRARVEAARRHAKRALSRLELALGPFHRLELDLARGAMRTKEIECEQQLRRFQELDERIAAVEGQLRRQEGLTTRLLRPRLARRQREQLLQRLQRLRQQRDSADVYISEDELLRWLDVLVNTSLHTDHTRWQRSARHARLLLYRLLNTYCLQQELAAHQVATRALPGINVHEAIGYYLKSEEFMLAYFARKRREVMLWLAGAGEAKLAKLEETRDALLAEYRRHARRRAGPGGPAAAIAAGAGPGAVAG